MTENAIREVKERHGLVGEIQEVALVTDSDGKVSHWVTLNDHDWYEVDSDLWIEIGMPVDLCPDFATKKLIPMSCTRGFLANYLAPRFDAKVQFIMGPYRIRNGRLLPLEGGDDGH